MKAERKVAASGSQLRGAGAAPSQQPRCPPPRGAIAYQNGPPPFPSASSSRRPAPSSSTATFSTSAARDLGSAKLEAPSPPSRSPLCPQPPECEPPGRLKVESPAQQLHPKGRFLRSKDIGEDDVDLGFASLVWTFVENRRQARYSCRLNQPSIEYPCGGEGDMGSETPHLDASDNLLDRWDSIVDSKLRATPSRSRKDNQSPIVGSEASFYAYDTSDDDLSADIDKNLTNSGSSTPTADTRPSGKGSKSQASASASRSTGEGPGTRTGEKSTGSSSSAWWSPPPLRRLGASGHGRSSSNSNTNNNTNSNNNNNSNSNSNCSNFADAAKTSKLHGSEGGVAGCPSGDPPSRPGNSSSNKNNSNNNNSNSNSSNNTAKASKAAAPQGRGRQSKQTPPTSEKASKNARTAAEVASASAKVASEAASNAPKNPKNAAQNPKNAAKNPENAAAKRRRRAWVASPSPRAQSPGAVRRSRHWRRWLPNSTWFPHFAKHKSKEGNKADAAESSTCHDVNPAEEAARLILDMEELLESTSNHPLERRRAIFRDLQRKLHPDKNVEREESAKMAFQALMSRKGMYLRP